MKKEEIIQALNNERDIHQSWAEQESIIPDAINLDLLIEPDNYIESDLYLWIKSNKSYLSAFPWYKDIKQVNAKVHFSYSDFFKNATRKYNPKTRDELVTEFENVISDIKAFEDLSNEIENDISLLSDTSYLDLILKSNASSRKKNLSSVTNNFVSQADDENKTEEDIETIVNPNILNTPSTDNENALGQAVTRIEPSLEDYTDAIDVQSKTIETETSAISSTDMENVNIVEYKKDAVDKDFNENSIVETTTTNDALREVKDTQDSNLNTTSSFIEKSNEEVTKEYKSLKTEIYSDEMIEKHITLKEQNIQRLVKEQELTEQELVNLNSAEQLAKQGLKQIEQHLSLKQEEVQLEQTDSDLLLQKNATERENTEKQLDEIKFRKETLRNEIIDLEQENIKDELIQEDFKKRPSIEKQFDVLKQNKINEVTELQEQLTNKNTELEDLKKQVLMMEDEIADIEDDIEMKQQGILSLEEKEKAKNEERKQKIEATKSIIKQRNETINAYNEKLDALLRETEANKQTLDQLNDKFDKIKSTVSSLAHLNNSEIDEIKFQQVKKQEQLSDIENQKTRKENEINEIQNRIDDTKQSLAQLTSKLKVDSGESDEALAATH